jgi:hypothetical protein
MTALQTREGPGSFLKGLSASSQAQSPSEQGQGWGLEAIFAAQ